MNEEKAPGLGELLRSPGEFMGFAEGKACSWRFALFLAAVTAAGCGLFGFAVGSFVDLKVAALDTAKMVGVAAFSFALSFPTLYVFSTICGSRLSPARTAVLGLVCTATFGCILAALSPILWLFAVSTESVGFIVFLACFLAWLALVFVVRPISAAKGKGVVARSIGLHAWTFVLVVVSLQAVTLVRPMLAPLGSAREPDGKCFFLMHFAKSLSGGNSQAR